MQMRTILIIMILAHLKMCQFFAIGLFVRGVRCVLRTANVCVSLKLSMWNDEKNHSDFHHSCMYSPNAGTHFKISIYEHLNLLNL